MQQRGIVAMMPTTLVSAASVAVASLAGRNVVTSFNGAEAQDLGMGRMPSHDERHERTEEFVAVVEGLWDGWENDALVLDKVSGRFVDPAKMEVLKHAGKYFTVKGPLTCPPSPQRCPVLVQAGDGEPARRIAAGVADSFDVNPGYLSHRMQDFAELVVPELQRRGLFRTAYDVPTLRDQLGLPQHRSRWDLARQAARQAQTA